MAESSLADASHHAPLPAVVFGWNINELKALGIALALLVVWIGAAALFGFAGLITVALLMVLTSFVLIVTISRG